MPQDADQLEHAQYDAALPDIPEGPSVLGAYVNEVAHNLAHNQQPPNELSEQEHPSPRPPHAQRVTRRRGSSASRVDPGFFDPAGVRELGRTLSRMSHDQHTRPRVSESHVQEKDRTRSSSSQSDTETLFGGENFDFGKTLRYVLRK
jgi:ATP-binding cassette, subfamily G (WHITE), member 2, SNQ2